MDDDEEVPPMDQIVAAKKGVLKVWSPAFTPDYSESPSTAERAVHVSLGGRPFFGWWCSPARIGEK